MNSFNKHLIWIFSEKLKSRAFDQVDVCSFFALNRDYFPSKSISREIGNFLAHPKGKDRGATASVVSEAIETFEKFLDDKDAGKEVDSFNSLRFDGLGDESRLPEEIRQIFKSAKVDDGSFEIETQQFRELVCCLIFTLSESVIKVRGSELEFHVDHSYDTTLYLTYESSKYRGTKAELPFLKLYYDKARPAHVFGEPRERLNEYVLRRTKLNELVAIPYKEDLNLLTEDKSIESLISLNIAKRLPI